MPDTEPLRTDFVVVQEFGDHKVGDVLTDAPAGDHAHRVVRRALPPAAPAEAQEA